MGGLVREDVGTVWTFPVFLRRCSVKGSLGADTLISVQTNAELLWGAPQGCCISADAQFIWYVKNWMVVLLQQPVSAVRTQKTI